jgi:predicted TIM-barrel fold metal-dependent hydrolase
MDEFKSAKGVSNDHFYVRGGRKKMKKNQFQRLDRRTFLKGMSLGAASTFAVPAVLSARSEPRTIEKDFTEKIDMFCHILPPKYKEALFRKANKSSYYLEGVSFYRALFDLDMRFRLMDKFQGLRQVLTLAVPPLEYVCSPNDAADLARKANDEMAELVNEYPDRFVSAAACLPLNDVDASIIETERATKELKFKGVQLYSSVNGKALDRPEFMGLYEKIAQHDLLIWLHPARDNSIPDYAGEKLAKYDMFMAFGWPYETTMAMARLVCSGIMEKYSNIRIIAHHCGGMLPFFFRRIPERASQPGEIMKLTKPAVEYFKKFYADTVLGGNIPALMCGYAFFSAARMLFATDYPYPGPYPGDAGVGIVIKSVELMDITNEDKTRIFSSNAREILSLS